MKSEEKNIYKYLSIFFWLNIIAFSVGLLFLLWYKGPNFGENVETSVVFERYAIILTLGSIPLALKVFYSLVEKNKILSPDKFRNKYAQLYILRILVLDLVVIMNLIGFYLYESNNFIYMTLVILIANLFCYPSLDAMESADKDENIMDVENDEIVGEKENNN